MRDTPRCRVTRHEARPRYCLPQTLLQVPREVDASRRHWKAKVSVFQDPWDLFIAPADWSAGVCRCYVATLRYLHRNAISFADGPFRRGDDECLCVRSMTQLSQRDRVKKRRQQSEMQTVGRFTNVDFLLNEGEWDRAYQMLQRVRATLVNFFVGDADDSDSTRSEV